MLFITNTFADAEVLSRAIIGSACRAEAAEAAWRIRIAEVGPLAHFESLGAHFEDLGFKLVDIIYCHYHDKRP